MKDLVVSSRQEKIDFSVFSNVIVVGQNPEMSDIGNPNGDIHEIVYFVVGTYPNGERIRHERNFENEESAYRLQSRIEEANFINIRYWNYYHPVYGSQAYILEEEENFLRFEN